MLNIAVCSIYQYEAESGLCVEVVRGSRETVPAIVFWLFEILYHHNSYKKKKIVDCSLWWVLLHAAHVQGVLYNAMTHSHLILFNHPFINEFSHPSFVCEVFTCRWWNQSVSFMLCWKNLCIISIVHMQQICSFFFWKGFL